MRIVICNSLGNQMLKKFLDSLLETIDNNDFDLHIFKEREYREVTLNEAIQRVKGDDLFIFGDDIEFTTGWYQQFERYRDKGDIIGFSMLYPGTNKVQDAGYNLVSIDGNITLEAQNRGKDKSELIPFGFRECDALCGCAMFIKKEVLEKVPHFSLDGQNRWGEFIFTHTAKKYGFKVIVLDHFLYHQGASTKVNKNIKYSSISYMVERDIWEDIVSKYVDKAMIKFTYRSVITDALSRRLAAADDVLLYGAGTVSEVILRYLQNKRVVVCSGLPEEQGMLFHEYVVEDYARALDRYYDLIVMTPLDVGISLYERYVAPRCQGKAGVTAIAIKLRIERDKYVYEEQQIV